MLVEPNVEFLFFREMCREYGDNHDSGLTTEFRFYLCYVAARVCRIACEFQGFSNSALWSETTSFMRIGIGQKIFLGFLLAALVVLALTTGVTRWSFERGFLNYVNENEAERA